ncbi:S-formylglutathione hydrolase [Amphibiibacter pelophylacis]|uniref:S-formylglutathione hydrolase n=1 Tax=Amphibiibacter pelophylacis TaxID=1799477 RepID=A0ACC6P4I4_9BURK
MALELLASHGCFGGQQRFYRFDSGAIGRPMRVGVYLPPQALAPGAAPVPAVFFLAGLTCSEETFAIKAGAQRVAADLGLALVTPDTSPRGAGVPGEDADWDFGLAAGFYLNATQAPWATHYRMEDHIVHELPGVLAQQLPLDVARLGLCGHSMGGHGALTLALRHPGRFAAVTALAPICAPSQVPWGEKAFSGYLGPDRSAWTAHDASALMAAQERVPYPDGILIDQGLDDKFLASQLRPEVFEAACAAIGQPLTLRRHAGQDHGYFFIQSHIEDHLRWQARALNSGA